MNTAPTYSMITLSTECDCQYYDDNEELQPSLDCYGCYDDELSNLTYELKAWAEANGYDEYTEIRIDGSGMGWTRASGFTTCTIAEIPKALTINGDYRIDFMFSEDYKRLTAVRFSHDEPTGTGLFSFKELTI
jgi:hypothetical protein